MNRKKLENFWYYNKWLVIGGAALLVLLLHLILSVAGAEKEAFSGILLNCAQREEKSALAADFSGYAGIDPDQSVVNFDSSIQLTREGTEQNIQAFQAILARVAAEQVDFIVANQENFCLYSYNSSGIFCDLRDCFSEEVLQLLEGHIFYIDRAFETLILENADNADFFENLEFPDAFNPENMEEPVPMGIGIGSCEAFLDSYSSGGEAVYLGILSNAPHSDLAAQLVLYLHGLD